MGDFEKFLSRFNFDKRKKLHIGMERECFLTDLSGRIIPIARDVLEYLKSGSGKGRFGYELSACQLEDRVGPVLIGKLSKAIVANNHELKRAERDLGFKRMFCEVAPDDMPLDVYPDPTGRYQKITKEMPKNILLAACQVTGIHFHIGMPDKDSALKVYNSVIKECENLCRLGDCSNGKRLSIYRIMAPDYFPRPYESWEEYHAYAVIKGFESDPRKCWHLIRISIHGTIEFRMFGSTSSHARIIGWAKKCHEICRKAFLA